MLSINYFIKIKDKTLSALVSAPLRSRPDHWMLSKPIFSLLFLLPAKAGILAVKKSSIWSHGPFIWEKEELQRTKGSYSVWSSHFFFFLLLRQPLYLFLIWKFLQNYLRAACLLHTPGTYLPLLQSQFSISACRNILMDTVKLLLNISTYGLWILYINIPAVSILSGTNIAFVTTVL